MRNLQGQELIGYLDSFTSASENIVKIELTLGEVYYLIRKIERAEKEKILTEKRLKLSNEAKEYIKKYSYRMDRVIKFVKEDRLDLVDRELEKLKTI